MIAVHSYSFRGYILPFILKGALLLWLLPTLLFARNIQIDTGTSLQDLPAVEVLENGVWVPFTFDDAMVSAGRLTDGTVEIRIRGDLTLQAQDRIRGIGKYPVVFEVGNNVEIPPSVEFDFSAIGLEPGAGGGEGKEGSDGSSGGRGGEGGDGGRRGNGGIGGLGFDAGTFAKVVPFSLTTPGITAISGEPGTPGFLGIQGDRGDAGVSGTSGFGLSQGGGAGGKEVTPEPRPQSVRPAGGAGGQKASYPPWVYIQNDTLRGFILNPFLPFDASDEEEFRSELYDGSPGGDAPGIGNTDLPVSSPALPTHDGQGGRNLAPAWLLTGGSSGGSGSGGAGGAGGAGGGGGGGGAGGHGEWMEPFPSTWQDLISDIAGNFIEDELRNQAENKLNDVLNRLFKRLRKEASFDIKLPDVEIGASGARGGEGGDGGFGSDGGRGGQGGDSGAGGGALKIVAQGIIFLEGQIDVSGADGQAGTGGEIPMFSGIGSTGRSAGIRIIGSSIGNVIEEVILPGDGDIASPNAGLGGGGGDGAQGRLGNAGTFGGSGGGGAGGTVMLVSSHLEGSGSIAAAGGSSENAGGQGRLFVGLNTVTPTTTAQVLPDSIQVFPAEIDLTAPANTGPLTQTPFVAGLPLVPSLPSLVGGAEAFGDTGFNATAPELQVLEDPETTSEPLQPVAFPLPDAVDPDLVGLLTTTQGNAVIAALRTDLPPASFINLPGYDYVFVFNVRDSELEDVHFGCNLQRLDSNGDPVADATTGTFAPFHSALVRTGGSLNDPFFGGAGDLESGILSESEVYVFLIPEDTVFGAPEADGAVKESMNFYLSATDASNPNDIRTYTIEVSHLEVGKVLTATFDPAAATIYQATWNGGASGDWNEDTNWSTIDLSTGLPSDPGIRTPDNTTSLAYNVEINLSGASSVLVTQDEKVIIDRFEIGRTHPDRFTRQWRAQSGYFPDD